MTEQKKVKLMGGAVLALAVVTLFGIAYAAFTQNLRINGSATAVATSWDIHFENLRPVDGSNNVTGLTNGTAVQLTAPSIDSDSLSIGDFSVSLTSPGDSIAYIFDVVNDGDYNAVLSKLGVPVSPGNDEYTWPAPRCTINGVGSTEAQEVCSHLTYTLNEYHVGSSSVMGKISQGRVLSSGSRTSMILKLTYEDFTTELNAITTFINNYASSYDGIINSAPQDTWESEISALYGTIAVSDTIPSSSVSAIQTFATSYDSIGRNSNLTDQQKSDQKAALKSSTIQSFQSDYSGKLPTADVTVSNLGFSMIYSQNGNANITP